MYRNKSKLCHCPFLLRKATTVHCSCLITAPRQWLGKGEQSGGSL